MQWVIKNIYLKTKRYKLKLEIQKKSVVSYDKMQDYTHNDQILHNKERVNFETYYMELRRYFWEQYYESIDDIKYEIRDRDKMEKIIIESWKESRESEIVYRLIKQLK